jgi:ATP-binding cassette subfamily B protein
MEKKEKKIKEKSNLVQNLKYIISSIHHHEKGFLFLNILAVVSGSIEGFVAPYILKIIIDTFSSVDTITKELFMDTLIKVIIIVGIALVLDLVCAWINNTAWYRVVRLRSKVIVEVNEKILNMDYQTLENPDTQDMVEKAKSALGSNWDGYEGMYNNLKYCSIFLVNTIVASAIIFQAHFAIIFIVLGIAIVKALLKNKTNSKNKKYFWDVISPFRRKLSYVDNISNNFSIAKDLRLYKMRNFIEKEQKDVQNDIHKLLKENEKRNNTLEVFLTILDVLQQLALYAILIYQVFTEKITVGSFTLMLSSVMTLSSSLGNFFSRYADLINCSKQVNDLRKVLSREEPNLEKKLGLEGDCTIEFQHVSYRYLGAKEDTIKDVSFVLHPKEKLALVGYNGAGKTTLMKLLMGLYHPTSGKILLNGVDTEIYDRKVLYQVFAPVFQDTNCFNFTISENIAMKFGKDVSEEKVKNAILLAGLEEKINSLPQGTKTILLKELDEKGIELSGGELQKLALARAIYKNSKVIILDEPTSALDALAEYKMYRSFNDIVQNASAIYISHRLSSTHFCDKIILLKDGKISEMGTHTELMENKKDYYDLFSLQAKYYQKEELNHEEN